jgi:hypothetical protein
MVKDICLVPLKRLSRYIHVPGFFVSEGFTMAKVYTEKEKQDAATELERARQALRDLQSLGKPASKAETDRLAKAEKTWTRVRNS